MIWVRAAIVTAFLAALVTSVVFLAGQHPAAPPAQVRFSQCQHDERVNDPYLTADQVREMCAEAQALTDESH